MDNDKGIALSISEALSFCLRDKGFVARAPSAPI